MVHLLLLCRRAAPVARGDRKAENLPDHRKGSLQLRGVRRGAENLEKIGPLGDEAAKIDPTPRFQRFDALVDRGQRT